MEKNLYKSKKDTINNELIIYCTENVEGIVFKKYGKSKNSNNIAIEIPNLLKFRDMFLDFNFDINNPKSGKPISYANYMEYIFQNYYDNFTELLDPFDVNTTKKLNRLRNYPEFKCYNKKEGRFPNAAIEAYHRFMESLV